MSLIFSRGIVVSLACMSVLLIGLASEWHREATLLNTRAIELRRAPSVEYGRHSEVTAWFDGLPSLDLTDGLLKDAIAWGNDPRLVLQFEQGASKRSYSQIGTTELLLSVRGAYGSCKELVSRILRDYPSVAVTELEFKRSGATEAMPIDARLKLRVFGAVRQSHGK